MVIALEDKWIWDSWYAHDGQRWHAFFLQADRSLGDPERRHWNVSQGHAVSDDLVHWRHLGTCFAPATTPAWDDYTTWTGSVVRDDTGLWHLFYTGTSRAEDGLKQRIGHATSTDLHSWRRVGTGLCLDLGPPYEEYAPGLWHDRAMRDPWVMRTPGGDGWLMFFTARVDDGPEANARGAIGLATSTDLLTWSLQAPVFSGGFGQLEVPQVLRLGERWYCLFCTDAGHWSKAYASSYSGEPVTGTHYLIADDPLGPWQIGSGPFLDGTPEGKRYAGRILETEEGPVFMGFLNAGPDGFIGVVSDPETVRIDMSGRLSLGEGSG